MENGKIKLGKKWVGVSTAARALVEEIQTLKNQTHLNILILGESGTGKEIVAQMLHDQENEAAGGNTRPYVIVNTPAVPHTLIESELFGVEKGAFTDAKFSRVGKFEAAHRGDLFLDEIGDLPLELQPKLLRVIQERRIERLGSPQKAKVSEFRVISATNRSLSKLIADNQFREDLFYRLADVILKIPPLRERRDDILPLADHFIEMYTPGFDPRPQLSAEAGERLREYDWPGNIRQLESTIKRALIGLNGAIISKITFYDPRGSDDFGPVFSAIPDRKQFNLGIKIREREIIVAAIARNGGDRTLIIADLGLSRATFYRKIKDLQIRL
jgi:DNA-binding NtrC family response regulator